MFCAVVSVRETQAAVKQRNCVCLSSSLSACTLFDAEQPDVHSKSAWRSGTFQVIHRRPSLPPHSHGWLGHFQCSSVIAGSH